MARKRTKQSTDDRLLNAINKAEAKPSSATGKSLNAIGNQRSSVINSVIASRSARRVVAGTSVLAGSARKEDEAAAAKAIARRQRRQAGQKGGAIVPSPGGALAEVDPGYQTSGKVGQGRKRSGVGSGSPLDIRQQNADKLASLRRLTTEGVGGERESAGRAIGVLEARQALRSSRNPNQFA